MKQCTHSWCTGPREQCLCSAVLTPVDSSTGVHLPLIDNRAEDRQARSEEMMMLTNGLKARTQHFKNISLAALKKMLKIVGRQYCRWVNRRVL